MLDEAKTTNQFYFERENLFGKGQLATMLLMMTPLGTPWLRKGVVSLTLNCNHYPIQRSYIVYIYIENKSREIPREPPPPYLFRGSLAHDVKLS